MGTPEAAGIVERVASDRLVHLRELPRHAGLVNVDTERYIDEHSEVLDEAREWVFDDTARTTVGEHNLKQMAVELLTADEPYPARDAHLVFAGFGEKEIFPHHSTSPTGESWRGGSGHRWGST